MAAFSRVERFLGGSQELDEFMTSCIQPVVLNHDGRIAVGDDTDDEDAGKD